MKIKTFLFAILLSLCLAANALAGSIINYPKFQALDSDGNPLSGGKVYTYVPGSTTPKATYSDGLLTTLNANPVVLDSRGEASIYGSGSYKIVLKTSANVTVWTLDNANGNAYSFSPWVDVRDYMDGQSGRPTYATWYANQATTDVTLVINAAIATGLDILAPNGTYATTGDHTITTQQLKGISKLNTIFMRLSGTNPIFTITGAGEIGNLTLDGNSLGGAALKFNGSDKGQTKNILLKGVAGTSYALDFAGTNTGLNFEDLEFSGNYGNINSVGLYRSWFNRTILLAVDGGYGINFQPGVHEIKFSNTYFIDSPVNLTTTDIREIWFDGYVVRIDTMTIPWWTAITSPGSEVAGIKLRNGKIRKYVNTNSIPIFDINSYQMTIESLYVTDLVSDANWSVIRDRGTYNTRLIDITVESTNAWLLFDAASTGGVFIEANGINYTQGVTGTASWSSNHGIASESTYLMVMNSTVNHSIASANSFGGTFINILGNIDLTNSNSAVTLIQCTGTITDPNNMARLSLGRGTQPREIYYHNASTYANNAAAVAAGLTVGAIYQTATGELRVVVP